MTDYREQDIRMRVAMGKMALNTDVIDLLDALGAAREERDAALARLAQAEAREATLRSMVESFDLLREYATSASPVLVGVIDGFFIGAIGPARAALAATESGQEGAGT